MHSFGFGMPYNRKAFLDSEEADTLEELKKTSAEEQAKLNKRRQKFQAQDSVLVEAMGKSMDE